MNDKTTEAVSKCMINLQYTFSLWELEFIYMISDWRWNLICDITLKMTMIIIIKFKCCLAVFDIWYNCQLMPWQKWWYHLVHCICRYQHFPDKIFDIFFIVSHWKTTMYFWTVISLIPDQKHIVFGGD